MRFKNPFRKPRTELPESETKLPPGTIRTVGGVPREAPPPPANRDFSKPPGPRPKPEEKP